MAHYLVDKGRRNSYFHKGDIRESLPEYFVEEYPNFVQFLQFYFDFLAEQEPYNFDREIHQLTTIRDLKQTPEEYLDLIIFEIGSRLKNDDLFTDGRFAAGFLNELYKIKGSRNSIEAFFRLFFQSEVSVEYPKEEIFRVGEDFIGPDAIRVIQDYKRYQTYSILIKVGLGVSQYRELYKKFVHPAGWYFEGEATLVGNASITFTTPVSVLDSALVAFASEVTLPITPFSEYHGLQNTEGGGDLSLLFKLDSINGNPTRSGRTISDVGSLLVGDLDSAYTIRSFVTPNSETFDDSQRASISTQQIYTSGFGSGSFYVPPAGFKYVEDSALATRQSRLKPGGPDTFLMDPLLNPTSGETSTNHQPTVRWNGNNLFPSNITGFFNNNDSDGTVKTFDSGDLLYISADPLAVYRVDSIMDTNVGGPGPRTEWSLSRLVIDSDGYPFGLGIDMSFDQETMDEDMFTRYLSDSNF